MVVSSFAVIAGQQARRAPSLRHMPRLPSLRKQGPGAGARLMNWQPLRWQVKERELPDEISSVIIDALAKAARA